MNNVLSGKPLNLQLLTTILIVVFSTNICIFVRPLLWRLLFNELMNKACHYSLIVTQFRDRYIHVKDNEIVRSVSLKYVSVSVIYRYMQVNLTVSMRNDF